MISPTTYLLDGPLMGLLDARNRKLSEMATALIAQRAYAVRGDAIKTLREMGFEFLDVWCLVDEAIYIAKQHVVSEAMSDQ